jgi:hypothetical protein
MYTAIGVKNIDTILPPPEETVPKNPAMEHIDALGGKEFEAFTGQDHQAHISAHLAFMSTNMAQNNPMIMASLEKNIFEHISLMSDEQVQMEMQEKIMQVQQLQETMQNPEVQQNPELKQEMDRLVMEIESRKAVLISEMMEEYVKEQNKLTGDFGNDPIAKLRARELDLKAQDNIRKEKEDAARINLDKMKAMMNQSYQQEKMDQTEDLAELRAETSITKQKMSNQAKAKADATKRFDVSTLKGPRR